MGGAIGRFLKGVKEAWESWAILAALGLVPAVPVVLAFFQNWSWDVIAIYGVGAVAFWMVLMVEGEPLWTLLTTFTRRMRQQLEVEIGPCCLERRARPSVQYDEPSGVLFITTRLDADAVARIGISNPGRRTVENVRVYVSAFDAEDTARPIEGLKDRVLSWVAPERTETYRIDPTPPGFHHHVEFLRSRGTEWELSLFGGDQRIDAKPYMMEVSVLGGDIAPSTVRVDVRPGDQELVQITLIHTGIFPWTRRRGRREQTS